MKTLIKNGNIVTESQVFKGDLLITDGIISAVGSGLPADGADVIDAAGKYVLPGAVDVHTHMDLQAGASRAVDDFYTGTIAAACGGTTSIVDHMAFGPKGCGLWHQVEEYHRLADGKAVVDYGFHGVIQSVDDNILAQMKEIAAKEGITSFKIYLTYDYRIEDGGVLRILEEAKKDGIVIAVHCENHGVLTMLRQRFKDSGCTEPKYHPLSRPNRSEAEAVGRMLHLSAMAGEAPVYIVHLSTKEGLDEVRKARSSGQKHFAVETCPQYLTMTDEKYNDSKEGLKFIMSPPLRKQTDIDALWGGLADGSIDTVATDHCPFNFAKEKQLGAKDFTVCPNGAPGVEERLSLLYSEGVAKGRITINQMVHLLCANPCRMYGLYPKKGVLQPGSDGDVVIFDPSKERVLTHKNLHSAVDYTCYEGIKVKGCIDMVLQRGKVIVKNNEFLGKRGDGKYLHREKSILV